MLSSIVGFLPSLVPFSVAEWFVALFLLFCLGYVGCCSRKIVVSKGERGIAAYRSTMGVAAICCAAYLAFTALCGLNYYRYTFASYTGYDLAQSDVDPAQRQVELEQLCTSLAGELGQVRTELGATRFWSARSIRLRSRCSPRS